MPQSVRDIYVSVILGIGGLLQFVLSSAASTVRKPHSLLSVCFVETVLLCVSEWHSNFPPHPTHIVHSGEVSRVDVETSLRNHVSGDSHFDLLRHWGFR